jgi:hypothetical protein
MKILQLRLRPLQADVSGAQRQNLKYKFYRNSSGRDKFLKEVWKGNGKQK